LKFCKVAVVSRQAKGKSQKRFFCMHFCAVFACNSCFKQSEKRHCVAIHCKLTNGLTETASVQTMKENTAKTPMFTKDTHGSAFLYQK